MSDIKVSEVKTGAIKDQSGAGLVTFPTKPFFHVIRTNSGGSISVNGIITFDSSPVTNQGSHWNTSGNYFLAPVAGVYQFNFAAIGAGSGATAVGAGGEVQVLLEKSTDNGGSYSGIINGSYYYMSTGAQTLPNMTFSASVLLAVNDRIRINNNKGYLYVGTTASKYNVTFTGHLIG